MRRFSVLLAVSVMVLLVSVPRLRALTDDEKRAAFLQSKGASGDSSSDNSGSNGDDSSASPTPHHKKHPSPSPTPHHHHSPEPEVTPHHHHSPTPEPDETPRHHTPTPKPDETPHHPVETAEPRVTPVPHITSEPHVTSEPHLTPLPRVTPPPSEMPASTPEPTMTPVPHAVAAPTPPPNPSGAQINIEKSGLESSEGFEPPPSPPPAHHHWWQFFGGEDETQYHYLTKAIRDAIDRAPVAKRRWRFIVVHNSGTRQGNAKIFDYYHRNVRKMPNGLAYHFVIGNGTSSGNGQIEIGGRWTKQLQGGHVHSDYLNNISLGICLVGDFNRDLPTKEQLEALDELIRYLRVRVGKIDRKPAIVKAHREINPPQWPTDCPGDKFPYHWLHSRFD